MREIPALAEGLALALCGRRARLLPAKADAALEVVAHYLILQIKSMTEKPREK